MAWIHDEVSDAEHEGYTIGVLASGVTPTRRNARGAIVEIAFMEGTWWTEAPDEEPGEDAAWMVPACICGWRGARVPYTGYDPLALDVGRDQWDTHMGELAARLLPRELADKTQQVLVVIDEFRHYANDNPSRALPLLQAMRSMGEAVDEQIVRVVGAARRAGESWATIGRALGVTRQTAWQTYHDINGSSPEQ